MKAEAGLACLPERGTGWGVANAERLVRRSQDRKLRDGSRNFISQSARTGFLKGMKSP